MYSVVPMKIAKIGHIVSAVFLFALGLSLILYPDFSVPVVEKVCGVYLILFGAIKMVGYLSRDIYRLAFQYDSVFGIILVGIGIAFLARPESTLTFVSILLGLAVFSDGVIKVQVAHHARKFGIEAWWAIFLLAVLAGIGGLCIVIHPMGGGRARGIVLGVVLMVDGVMSALTVLTSVKIKEYSDPRIEVTYITPDGDEKK